MSDKQRQLIAVLGMHRSGTSALARVVNLLGAALPAHLVKPAPDNPTGFWESDVIAATNELMLTTAGAGSFNCLTFDAVSIPGAPLVDVLRSILQSEFGDADLFMLKDLRLCLTLSLWLPTFANMRIRLSPLLVLRNPVDVVRSLYRRDLLEPEPSVLLWLRYMLDAERQTRGFSRSVVSYDRLLLDWRHCLERAGREADIAWPNSGDETTSHVDHFLNADLRHHSSSFERLPSVPARIWDWMAEVYQVLRQAEQAGFDQQQLNRLDRVRGEFDRMCHESER